MIHTPFDPHLDDAHWGELKRLERVGWEIVQKSIGNGRELRSQDVDVGRLLDERVERYQGGKSLRTFEGRGKRKGLR